MNTRIATTRNVGRWLVPQACANRRQGHPVRAVASHGHDARATSRKFRRGLVLLAALVLSAASPAAAQNTAERITELVRRYEQQSGATVGLSVRSMDGGTLMARNADRRFVPASNQKILTSAFALTRLGSDHRFTTRVLAAGRDLVVVGGFDPTLGDSRIAEENERDIYYELDRWAKAAAEHYGPDGLRHIVVAVNRPDGPYRPEDWPADQHQRWYAAPVAELNYNNNCYHVSFAIIDAGVVAKISPESRFIRVANNVTRGSRHVWSLSAAADESAVTLRGQITTNTPDPLPVAASDPPLLLARVLAERLEAADVSFGGDFHKIDRDLLPAEAMREIARTETPISAAIHRSNKRSLNMAAESLLLAAGDGDWPGSADQMAQTLTEHFGLADDALLVRDGSGLSRRNQATPAAMTRVLTALASGPDVEVFVPSLAVSGVDGTLENRLAERPWRGRIAAKTGYVRWSSCLSGYVLDTEGNPVLAFSMLINNVPAGQAWRANDLNDAICRELVKAIDG